MFVIALVIIKRFCFVLFVLQMIVDLASVASITGSLLECWRGFVQIDIVDVHSTALTGSAILL